MPTPAPLPPSRPPWGVWLITAVLGAEALMLLSIVVLAVISLLGDRSRYGTGPALASGIFLAALCLFFGIALIAVAVQLTRGLRWTRAAAFVWQLLMLALIVPAVLIGFWAAALLLLPPLTALALLFSPRVVAFTMRQNQPPAL